jgi:hypothetical protein
VDHASAAGMRDAKGVGGGEGGLDFDGEHA